MITAATPGLATEPSTFRRTVATRPLWSPLGPIPRCTSSTRAPGPSAYSTFTEQFAIASLQVSTVVAPSRTLTFGSEMLVPPGNFTLAV